MGNPDLPVAPHLADAVYRLTLHARTLTADWYVDMLDWAELAPQQWVEAIEVVVAVADVDGFADAPAYPGPHRLPRTRLRRGPHTLDLDSYQSARTAEPT